MVFTAAGEQRMDFRTHNTTWEAVDFDGIKLMRRPLPNEQITETTLKPGFSNAAKQRFAQKVQARNSSGKKSRADYTVIDLETTGLSAGEDEIIEYGALRVRDGAEDGNLSMLVHISMNIPGTITQITGLTDTDLEDGTEPQEALRIFLEFIGDDTLIGQNISFDMDFIRCACRRYGKSIPANRCVDLIKEAKKKLRHIPNYKLVTLAQHFQIADRVEHRALSDCRMVNQIYCKLNE